MNKETLRLQMLSGIITESEYRVKLEEGSLSIPSKAEKISDKVIKWYEKHPNDKMKELLNSVEKNLEKMLSKTTGKNAIKVEEFEKMVKSKYPKPFEDPNYSTFKKSLNEHYVAGGIVGIGAITQIPPREKSDYEMAFEHFLGERYETKFENKEQDLEEDKDPDVYESEDDMPEAPSHEETDANQVYEEDLQQSDVESVINGKKLDLKKLEDATKKAMSGDSTDLTLYLAGVFEGKEVKKLSLYEEDSNKIPSEIAIYQDKGKWIVSHPVANRLEVKEFNTIDDAYAYYTEAKALENKIRSSK